MIKTLYWKDLTNLQRETALMRPASSQSAEIQQQTQTIIEKVKQQGDSAIKELSLQFDQCRLDQLSITPEELNHAWKLVDDRSQAAMQLAIANLTQYHQAQSPQIMKITPCQGVTLERHFRPIKRVGLYVPGGSAPLISTVMMLAIPAKIAGNPLKILCTPANSQGEINPHILVAAQMCGIEKIYKVGGAQAIAAMAYGTDSIPKVDKIYGPGNPWVTQAKIQVSQDPLGASCDLPAGPSEVLVIADAEANPEFVAADLLSQAEHGTDSQALLITTDPELAEQVATAISQQLKQLSRKHIAIEALAHSRFIIVDSITTAITLSNQYAPEHLILNCAEAAQYLPQVSCAGTVFIGTWAAESLGDYVSGSNHVLPTYGHARSISGLGLNDFLNFFTVQYVTSQGLQTIGPAAECLAALEGLTAHQQAVSIRLQTLEETV